MPFSDDLARIAAEVDRELDHVLGALVAPERLVAAMRHAVLAGGKRLRPFLVVESAALFGVTPASAMPVAVAIECLHTYSLIHDDLPAMDDDVLRRGQPTVHVAFDEATAILAGDALQALAFEIIADRALALEPDIRARLAADLAAASGAGGMVGGQMLDLAFEAEKPGMDEIAAMQAMKTGALFGFACTSGATMARAASEDHRRLATFAARFGAAFQITDDLLDQEVSSDEAGKLTGKDARRGKATFVAGMGVDGARAEVERLVGAACGALAPYGPRADNLRAVCRYLMTRRS
jgi:farnesyl diphosphate synthase